MCGTSVQWIAGQTVVVRPEVVQDQRVLVNGEILMLRTDTVERTQSVLSDTAQRGKPCPEPVAVVTEHRVLMVVQAPVVLGVHRARGKIGGVAFRRGQVRVVYPVDDPCLITDPVLRGEICVGRLLTL